MSKNNNSQLPRAGSNIDVMRVGYITLNNKDRDIVGGDIEDEHMEDEHMEDIHMEDQDIEDEDTDYEDTDDENIEDESSRARTQESQQINTSEGSNTHTPTTEASNASGGRRSCRLMAGLSNTTGSSMTSTPTAGSSNSVIYTTSIGADNANATNSKHFTSEKDDDYYKMINELTAKRKIIRRIRLPVHPSACIVCRLCLICSHKHGQAACPCASLGEGTPKKGYRLLPFMTDSRVIVSDFACRHLRKFTIDWVEKNAHKVYQPLHYANAVPAGYISVCSAHSSKYFSDCKNKFKNAKNANRLAPDSVRYQMYEEEKKRIEFPTGIFKYISDRRAGWNQSKVDMHKKQNKSKFYLLCLDTCESVAIDEGKTTGGNSRVTIRKRKAADVLEKSNKKGNKKEDNSSSTEDDPDLVTVSIWNAPSLETHSLNDSYNLSFTLLHLPGPKAADALVFENINIRKRESFSELLKVIKREIMPVDTSQVRFRFVKNYESVIEMQSSLFDKYSGEWFNGNHLDLYIGSSLQR